MKAYQRGVNWWVEEQLAAAKLCRQNSRPPTHAEVDRVLRDRWAALSPQERALEIAFGATS